MDYDGFVGRRYIPSLDGLRAVSILLVLLFHTNTILWTSLNGWVGVEIFFVISGFLITTLLIREEAKFGRVSLAAFYVRRSCRIFPLYYAALAAYVVLYLVLGFRTDGGALKSALPYYLTYFNDFTHWAKNGTPFQQSWSLGVEEKFYLVWPALAFALWWSRRRGRLLLALAAALVVLPLWALGASGHYAPYSNIMVGCALAVALHNRRLYDRLIRFSRSRLHLLAIAAAVGAVAISGQVPNVGRIVLPFFVAWAMVGFVTQQSPLCRLLDSRPMVYVGQRAYGIYLVHLLVLLFVGTATAHLFPSVQFDAVGHPLSRVYEVTAIRIVVALALSLAAAEAMHRWIEAPMIARGRRWSKRITGSEPVAPDRLGAGARPGELLPAASGAAATAS